MSEWLRRWTRNPLGSAREGSNPFGVVFYLAFLDITSRPCSARSGSSKAGHEESNAVACVSIYSHSCSLRQRRQWCSGSIDASHASDPGSIPGWRILPEALLIDRSQGASQG